MAASPGPGPQPWSAAAASKLRALFASFSGTKRKDTSADYRHPGSHGGQTTPSAAVRHLPLHRGGLRGEGGCAAPPLTQGRLERRGWLCGTSPCTGEAFGAAPVLLFPPAAYPVFARIFPPRKAVFACPRTKDSRFPTKFAAFHTSMPAQIPAPTQNIGNSYFYKASFSQL